MSSTSGLFSVPTEFKDYAPGLERWILEKLHGDLGLSEITTLLLKNSLVRFWPLHPSSVPQLTHSTQAAYVRTAKNVHSQPNSGKVIYAALKIAKTCLPSGDTRWRQLLPELSLTGDSDNS
jgi:hypothetical protein